MDAGNALLGILGVHFIFRLAILFGDGEHSQGGKGFDWIGWLWVERAETKVKIVGDVHNCQATGGAQNKTLENDSKGSHV